MCVSAEETGGCTFYSFIVSFLHYFIVSLFHSFILSFLYSSLLLVFGTPSAIQFIEQKRIKIDYGKCFGYRGTPQRGQVHAV